MGKRGPKPAPNTTAKPGPIPEPPDFLTHPDALDVWQRYAVPLNALGLLESLDAIAFGMLCDAVVGYAQAAEQLSREDLVQVVGEGGALQQHPLVSIVRQQSKGVRELLSEFGMTPGSRSALTGSTSATPHTGEVDPLEELMKQHGQLAPPVSSPVPSTPKKRKAAAKASKGRGRGRKSE